MTFLFLLLTCLYVYRTITITTTFYIINKTISSGHSTDFTLLRYAPGVLILPVFFSLAAILFFYCSLKLRDRSPLGWLISITSLISVPCSLWLIAKNTLGSANLVPIPSLYLEHTFLFSIFLLISLIIKRKEYQMEGKTIAFRYRIVLLVFFIFLTLPLFIYAGYAFYTIKSTDYDFKKIQKEVDFRLIKPTKLPDGREYESKFYIAKKPLYDSAQTVQVQFDYPLPELISGRKPGLIVLLQAKRSEELDLEKVFNSREASTSAKKIKLRAWKNSDAYIVEGTNETKLYYPTEHGTIVFIRAYYISKKELLDFAANLK